MGGMAGAAEPAPEDTPPQDGEEGAQEEETTVRTDLQCFIL